ncbi:ribonuclease G [Mesobaculum littorinae]|uniref:Ribonuclease G n=1 Tax=Mesobaculum littorinae TaxID=2486419 RepID=A0A438AMU0_9RHOB|nr:ribonuclease E/G [Mesobaculum littorinae]RVV99917.1 ribonuclease G [Mesobaculum littorinae]
MKGRQVVLDHVADRDIAVLIEDGQIEDLLVDAPDTPLRPGAIARATVDRAMTGQGGAMLRLPEGMLYLRDGKGLKPGESLLVQVQGWAMDGKAATAARRLLFKSRYAIVTPGAPGINVSRAIRDEERRVALLEIASGQELPEGAGLILRSASETADDDEIAADIAAMADLADRVLGDPGKGAELLADGPGAHELAWRDWPTPDALEEGPGSLARTGAEELVARCLSPRVDLPGGGHLWIEPTRALVAVDVNTGGDTSLAAGLKADIAMARRLPAELRCRGLGGQIVIDLAPLAKKERRNFEQILRAAFRSDPVETVLAGWTPLGLFELQRRRDRLPLSTLLPKEVFS